MDNLDNRWFKAELPVLIDEEGNFDVAVVDGKLGVMYSGGGEPNFVKGEAAFLFGETEENLYFRPSFSLLAKIEADEDEKRDRMKRLFNSSMAAFITSPDSDAKVEYGIPVYHDALGMLSHLLFEEDGDETESEEFSASQDQAETTGPIENTPEQMAMKIDEIQAAIDQEVKYRGGGVLFRFRPAENQRDKCFAYDIVEVASSHLVVAYSPYQGNWLADEDSFMGEPPMWFSEIDHVTSPVFFARKCCNYFAGKLADAAFTSVVIMPGATDIVNEEEMLRVWRDKCQVSVVRTRRADNSALPALGEFLSSLPGCGELCPHIDPAVLSTLAGKFANKG